MRNFCDQYLIGASRAGIVYLKMILDENGAPVDFEYLYINQAFESISGFSADSYIGKKASDLPKIRLRAKQRLAVLLRDTVMSGQPTEYDFSSFDESKHFNIRFDSPKKDLCIVTLRDVSEIVNRHLRDIEELKKSECRNSIFLSNLPGMAYQCMFEENPTMLFVSEGCYDLTGYRPDALIGNRVVSYNGLIHTEDREEMSDRWNRAAKDHGMFKGEYRIKTATGQIRWVYEQGQVVFDENGEPETIEGLIIDISKQKMREARIEYLLKHDPLTGLHNRIQFEAEKKRLSTEAFFPLTIVIGDINGLKLVNEAFGSEEGDKLIVAVAKILRNCARPIDFVARIGGDEFGILMPNSTADEANTFVKRVQRDCEDHNRIANGSSANISLGFSTLDGGADSIASCEKEAEDYLYRHKLMERDSTCSTILSSIKTTMFERSQETKEHAERMTELSREVGRRLALSQLELDDLALLATLHDVGKVVIDNGILMKPGELTTEEWTEMRKHPEIGYRIASASQEMASIANGILSHHERWDGDGYPRGLRGPEIPLMARIISVVDAYDAMTEERVYRKAMTHEYAIDEIRRNAGFQFDPDVVSVFCAYLDQKEM